MYVGKYLYESTILLLLFYEERGWQKFGYNIMTSEILEREMQRFFFQRGTDLLRQKTCVCGTYLLQVEKKKNFFVAFWFSQSP